VVFARFVSQQLPATVKTMGCGASSTRQTVPETMIAPIKSVVPDNNDHGKAYLSRKMKLKPTMSLNVQPTGYKGLARSKLVRSMIVKLYKDADEDGDGRINHAELHKLYTSIALGRDNSKTFQSSDAKKLMEAMDRKQDPSVLMEFEFVGSCMREMGVLDSGAVEDERTFTALQSLVHAIVEKVENMSIALHLLFSKYANGENMLTRRGMKKLLSNVAQEDEDKPTKNEIDIFVNFMDKNGDGQIEEKEFVSYMTRGFTQPKANIAAFGRRSAMHRKIYSFLFNIENSMGDRKDEILRLRVNMNEELKNKLMNMAVS